MQANRATTHQQDAIKAKLSMLLGTEEYDRVFVEFELTEFQWGVLNVRVRSQHIDDIQRRYWLYVAFIAESVLQRPVRALNLLSIDFADTNAR